MSKKSVAGTSKKTTSKKSVDTASTEVVASQGTQEQAAPVAEVINQTNNQIEENKTMNETVTDTPAQNAPAATVTLTRTGYSKNGRAAFYGGTAQPLRFSLVSFPNKTAPETIEVPAGVFASARVPKAKMTKEERKAAQAAKPKLTLAEKIAAREAALDKLRAKAAAEAAKATAPAAEGAQATM